VPEQSEAQSVVELRSLRVLGRHGVLDEEQARAQPFEVDLDVVIDMAAAARSDQLGDTVDYGAVLDAAAGVVAGPRCALLERLAALIGASVLGVDGRITSVVVVLRKLRPPVAHDVGSAGVRLTVTR